MRKVIIVAALLMVVIMLAVPVGALSISDETLSGILKGLPVIGDYTDDIIGTKQDINAALGEYVDDTIYGFKSLYTANKRQIDPAQILPDRQPYLHNMQILGDSHTGGRT